jgi:hypothetical protein
MSLAAVRPAVRLACAFAANAVAAVSARKPAPTAQLAPQSPWMTLSASCWEWEDQPTGLCDKSDLALTWIYTRLVC